jgi:signal transduction histidine kinase
MNVEFSNAYQEVLLENLDVILKQNFMMQARLKLFEKETNLRAEMQAKIEELNSQLEARIVERTDQLAKVVSQLLQTNTALKNEISERKKIESKLIKSKEKTQIALESERNLSKMKSRFITTTSHEFRTPLSTILSSAKLIGRYSDENGQ